MRVTSKGQVTIPIAIRERYRISSACEVDFKETDEGPLLVVRPPGQPPEGRLVDALRKARRHVRTDMTTDEIMRMMRGTGEPDPGFDESGE